MPSKHDIEGIFHPRTRFDTESFGELGAIDERFDVDYIEKVEILDEREEIGVLAEYS